MSRHGKAHWTDCREYYHKHQATLAEVDKSFRLPKPDQMRLALSVITSLPGPTRELVSVVDGIRRFEQTFIRIMRGLTPHVFYTLKCYSMACVNSLGILRQDTIAWGQAEQLLNKTAEEEEFHPCLWRHAVTWATSVLPRYVVTRAHKRRSEPSARIY